MEVFLTGLLCFFAWGKDAKKYFEDEIKKAELKKASITEWEKRVENACN